MSALFHFDRIRLCGAAAQSNVLLPVLTRSYLGFIFEIPAYRSWVTVLDVTLPGYMFKSEERKQELDFPSIIPSLQVEKYKNVRHKPEVICKAG